MAVKATVLTPSLASWADEEEEGEKRPKEGLPIEDEDEKTHTKAIPWSQLPRPPEVAERQLQDFGKKQVRFAARSFEGWCEKRQQQPRRQPQQQRSEGPTIGLLVGDPCFSPPADGALAAVLSALQLLRRELAKALRAGLAGDPQAAEATKDLLGVLGVGLEGVAALLNFLDGESAGGPSQAAANEKGPKEASDDFEESEDRPQ